MNIRPHVQVVIVRDRKLFCAPGYDPVKKEEFYRTVGGGIDFGELAVDAIKREVREEFNAELVNLKQIDITENIFIHMGKQGHEIIFLYSAEFKDSSMYEDKVYPILDNPEVPGAGWCSIDLFMNDEKTLYPEAVLNYLNTKYK